jgi:diguanylate cyclase (GGDEF)-like protein
MTGMMRVNMNNERIAAMNKELIQLDADAELDSLVEPQFSETEIKATLDKGVWFLLFPAHIEAEYRKQSRTKSIKTYHFNGIFAFIVFSVICFSVAKLIPPSSYFQCASIYAVGALIMLSVRLLSFFRMFDQWFYGYVTISATVMITIGVYANNAIPMGDASTLSYISLTYILFFTYCFVGLRLQLSSLANVIGGASGVLLTYATGEKMNWLIMPQTFATASALAMFLAYGLKRQERINFLQSYLLELSLLKSERLSREDALTGLANRRHLNEQMELEWSRMLRYQFPLTIMMIDIDFFKRYNDALGHLAGDKCLQQVAQMIHGLAHRSGELAARFGGEEFVLLFPNMDVDTAKQQAERLLQRLATTAIPHPHSNEKWVTVSIGISVCVPIPEMNVTQLLRQADQALYQAKSAGKNRYEIF